MHEFTGCDAQLTFSRLPQIERSYTSEITFDRVSYFKTECFDINKRPIALCAGVAVFIMKVMHLHQMSSRVYLKL